jgi:Calcineurin-like phosphoesterase
MSTMTRPLNPPGETPDVGVPAALAAEMTVAEQHDWLQGFLRARVVSRRAALRGAATAAAGLGLVGGLSSVLAACGSPSGGGGVGGATPLALTGRHLSFGVDPMRQMAIAGELTAAPAGKVLLDIGTDTGYGHTIEAQVRHLISHVPQQDGSISSADQYFVHGLADGLAPGQRYHYRFRLPGGGTTQDGVLRTAPSIRAPFTFTAFGDQGVNGPKSNGCGFTDDYYRAGDSRRTAEPASSLVALITKRRPAFHLLAGDICYADPTGDGKPMRNAAPDNPADGFDNFDPITWTRYFASIESSAAGSPWMFATGNHDMEAVYDDNRSPGGATHGYGGHAARLDLPNNGPSCCPSVYRFSYADVGVISVDANDLSAEIPTNAGYSGGAQLNWLRQNLSALRSDPNIDFIVVFHHHCAYATSASHASDGGVRSALAPLYDEFSVDLVVNGHNHQYERTNPIKAGRSGAQAPDGATVHPQTDGTTYICVGSGGRPRYTWQPGETDRYRGNNGHDSGTQVTSFIAAGDGKTPETVDWSQTRYLDYAVLSVDVTPGAPGTNSTMTVRAISDTGQEIDSVTLIRTPHPVTTPTALGSWTQTPTGLTIPT